jgi:hypothetical protein
MAMSLPIVYGQENSISLEVEKFTYFEGDEINISGSVQEILFGQDVNFMVIGPNGDVITIEKLNIDKTKQFEIEMSADSESLGDFGKYSVFARYGSENQVAKDTFSFEQKNKHLAPSESKKNVLVNFDFVNPHKKTIQEHIDYTITISKNGDIVFGPAFKHAASGSVSLPMMLAERQTHDILIEINGVMFQPIPEEFSNFSIMTGGQTILSEFTSENSLKINLALNKNPSPDPKIVPEWVKNNAKWWSDGQIDDVAFTQAIQYLIAQDIVEIPDLPYPASWQDKDVPSWVKNNAKWWADNLIEEDDFIKGIKYLVEKGVIQINQV